MNRRHANRLRIGLLGIGLVIASAVCVADEPGLFTDHQVLKLSLSVDFDELCRPRDDDNCEFTPTTMVYETAAGEKRNVPVEIQIRGGWRALRENCTVPPLFVRFSATETEGTPFAGQDLLPITTHCRSTRHLGNSLGRLGKRSSTSGADYEQYVLKEYLGYHLFNLLSDVSLRVRLAHITYQHPQKASRTVERYAFFTEHFESVAARHDATLLARGNYDPEYIDRTQYEILALYHFMIGNTDWSVVRQRNTILIALSDGTQLPALYDLDMSGLVNADYAAPAPDMPLRTVRQRLFQGFCPMATNWQPLFTYFQARRDDMFATVDAIPGLSQTNRKDTRRYLQKFFDILDSPKQREKNIIDHCQVWPPPPTTEPFAQ